jgi:hypothetical protein
MGLTQTATDYRPRRPSSVAGAREPSVYRYVMPHHEGFAPCFDDRTCTLACCKPGIRRTARPGDWVLGFAPRKSGDARLCYAMRVAEVVDFASYAADPRFKDRHDNIWQPDAGGNFRHVASHDIHDTPANRETDLSGRNVLIADSYKDFGKEGLDLRAAVGDDIALRLWYPGRGHKTAGLQPGDLDAFIRMFDEVRDISPATVKPSASCKVPVRSRRRRC